MTKSNILKIDGKQVGTYSSHEGALVASTNFPGTCEIIKIEYDFDWEHIDNLRREAMEEINER